MPTIGKSKEQKISIMNAHQTSVDNKFTAHGSIASTETKAMATLFNSFNPYQSQSKFGNSSSSMLKGLSAKGNPGFRSIYHNPDHDKRIPFAAGNCFNQTIRSKSMSTEPFSPNETMQYSNFKKWLKSNSLIEIFNILFLFILFIFCKFMHFSSYNDETLDKQISLLFPLVLYNWPTTALYASCYDSLTDVITVKSEATNCLIDDLSTATIESHQLFEPSEGQTSFGWERSTLCHSYMLLIKVAQILNVILKIVVMELLKQSDDTH